MFAAHTRCISLLARPLRATIVVSDKAASPTDIADTMQSTDKTCLQDLFLAQRSDLNPPERQRKRLPLVEPETASW